MKKFSLFLLLIGFVFILTADARYREGDFVEDFSLPDTSGSLVSLSDFSENIVCIYFWASS